MSERLWAAIERGCDRKWWYHACKCRVIDTASLQYVLAYGCATGADSDYSALRDGYGGTYICADGSSHFYLHPDARGHTDT